MPLNPAAQDREYKRRAYEEAAQARYLVQQLFQPAPAPAVNAPAAQSPAPQGGAGDLSAFLTSILQTMNTMTQRLQQIQVALQELKTLVQDRPVVGP